MSTPEKTKMVAFLSRAIWHKFKSWRDGNEMGEVLETWGLQFKPGESRWVELKEMEGKVFPLRGIALLKAKGNAGAIIDTGKEILLALGGQTYPAWREGEQIELPTKLVGLPAQTWQALNKEHLQIRQEWQLATGAPSLQASFLPAIAGKELGSYTDDFVIKDEVNGKYLGHIRWKLAGASHMGTRFNDVQLAVSRPGLDEAAQTEEQKLLLQKTKARGGVAGRKL